MTDLTGAQISSLLETLPGIAQVLRSPVADAFVGLIRAGTGQGEFNMAHAEEVMHYAVRRNLIAADESQRILAEAREALAPKPPPPPPPKPVRKKVEKPARASKAAKKPARKAAVSRARTPARAKKSKVHTAKSHKAKVHKKK